MRTDTPTSRPGHAFNHREGRRSLLETRSLALTAAVALAASTLSVACSSSAMSRPSGDCHDGAGGYAVDRHAIPGAAGNEVRLSLIVLSEKGKPLQEAVVEVVSEDRSTDLSLKTPRSGKVFPHVGPGVFRIVTSMPGHNPVTVSSIELRSGEDYLVLIYVCTVSLVPATQP